MPEIRIGTAGWTVPATNKKSFPDTGTHLQRYAAVFSAVEINSSFYRPHTPETYAKWADSVPEHFRFSVKLPKTITHEKRLRQSKALLDSFCREITGLNDKLGCLLIQLPPSFEFDSKIAKSFFKSLRGRVTADLACEPRHASWFEPGADLLMKSLSIARVAADPAVVSAAAVPGGSDSIRYYRFHGSPRMYYSSYSKVYLKKLARTFAPDSKCDRIWCFFDNTTLGKATQNALDLAQLIAS